MKTQLATARDRLFDAGGLDVANIKPFPGSNRDTTAEQMAGEINRALDQIDAGDFEIVENLDD